MASCLDRCHYFILDHLKVTTQTTYRSSIRNNHRRPMLCEFNRHFDHILVKPTAFSFHSYFKSVIRRSVPFSSGASHKPPPKVASGLQSPANDTLRALLEVTDLASVRHLSTRLPTYKSVCRRAPDENVPAVCLQCVEPETGGASRYVRRAADRNEKDAVFICSSCL